MQIKQIKKMRLNKLNIRAYKIIVYVYKNLIMKSI